MIGSKPRSFLTAVTMAVSNAAVMTPRQVLMPENVFQIQRLCSITRTRVVHPHYLFQTSSNTQLASILTSPYKSTRCGPSFSSKPQPASWQEFPETRKSCEKDETLRKEMVFFCFLVDQKRMVRSSKPAPGICSRCGGGASVADMKTATRFCYVPFYWKSWRAIICTFCGAVLKSYRLKK